MEDIEKGIADFFAQRKQPVITSRVPCVMYIVQVKGSIITLEQLRELALKRLEKDKQK
jgi:hypothetical protein